MSHATPALEVKGVSKRYGGVHALDGASLRVLPGQIVALLGENGAGKSTLMRIISGLEQPDSGSIQVAGQPARLVNPAAAHLHGIRMVPQELTLCPDLSVAENVELGRMVSRRGVLDAKAVAAAASDKLSRLGVSLDVHAQLSDLPLAEQAFVQIAQSLAPETRLVILDEPTAALSGDEAHSVLRAVRSVAAAGVGVIYISHRLDEVYDLADRIVVLRDGRVAADLSGHGVDPEAVVSAMVGGARLGHTREQGDVGPIRLQVMQLSSRRLTDFTAHVQGREIVAVYGVLGSGREEVAGCVVGATRRARGSVQVDGRRIKLSQGVRAAKGAGMGYVPAERRSQGLVLGKSVEFNATLAILRRLTRKLVFDRSQATSITRQLCADLGVKGDPSTPVETLSGGNQQKVLVARWLAADVGVLVLDEPTRGVDVGAKADMYDILRRQAASGTAILVCSSDLEEVCAIADRVLVVRDGTVVADLRQASETQVAAAASQTPTSEGEFS